MGMADWLRKLIGKWHARRVREMRARRLAEALHGAALSAARNPEFYLDFGVPDRFDGRFDLLLLQVFLLADRLEDEADDRQLATDALRLLQEVMFADFDRLLREMGVGDMSVGRHIRNMARAWAGRSDAYRRTTRSGSGAQSRTALVEALLRNLWHRAGPVEASPFERRAADRLARHALSVRERLAELPLARLEEKCAEALGPQPERRNEEECDDHEECE